MKPRSLLTPLLRLAVGTFWLAVLVGSPRCLGSTSTFLETFDPFPVAGRLAFYPPGEGSPTNLLGDGALRLVSSVPGVTDTAGVVAYDTVVDRFMRGRIVEQRLDVRKFAATSGYIQFYAYGQRQEGDMISLAAYGLLLGKDEVAIFKQVNAENVLAFFLVEQPTFELDEITLVLRFTPVGDSLSIQAQVLDKEQGDAVLFDRTVLDTPGKDPVSARTLGSRIPNWTKEDSGGPYWGPVTGLFGILHWDPTPLPATIEAVFDNYQFTTTGVGVDEFVGEVFTNAVGRTLPYRLFVPPTYDAANRYPLVLYLHGCCPSKLDNRSQVEDQSGFVAFASPEKQLKQPCLLLAPQSLGDWMGVVDRVLDLITNLQTRYSIDPDRLYVTGLSMGGWGTTDYLAYRPDLFAAGVPMSGASVATKAPQIAHIPIWAFCGGYDSAFINDVRGLVNALRADGGRPIYTEYALGGHSISTTAYSTEGLFEWLMAQRRGTSAIGPPEVTIQAPTTDATWTSWSTNVDLSGVVSTNLNVSHVMVKDARGITRGAKGTNSWTATGIRLYPGTTNTVLVQAYAPHGQTAWGGEISVNDSIQIVQKQLALRAVPVGDWLGLQWTPGADAYVLERCTDLVLQDWAPFLTTATTEVALPRTEKQLFYRVKLGP